MQGATTASRNPRLARTAAALAVTQALMASSQTYAQEDDASMIAEVLVTASRRAESVQDVPYNISAITGEELTAQGIDDFYQLSKSVPGVTVNDQSPRAGLVSTVIIRGLNNSGTGLNNVPDTQQPTVATYLNDTPIFANLRFKDVERVEVLRGPQGTLYGAGSFGGALRFIATKPILNEFGASVSAGTGVTADSDDMNYEGDLTLNIPFGETVAMRLNAGREYMAGYLDAFGLYQLDSNGAPALADPSDPVNSPALFQPTKKDVNDSTTDGARLAVRWSPSDAFDATLTYQYQKQEAGGRDIVAYVRGGDDSRLSGNVIDEPFESKVNLASLEATADFGFATLTSATSYLDTKAEGKTDYLSLYLNLGIYESIYGASPRPMHTQVGANNNEAFVQEFRLVSAPGGTFDWVVGAYYLDQTIELRNEQFYQGYQEYFDACVAEHGIWFTTGETVCGLGTITGVRNGINVTEETSYLSNVFTDFKDTALFGELTWHLTDKWQLTGGARVFRQEYTTNQQAGLLWTIDEPANRSASGKAEDATFKFNTSYDITDDAMVYATVSEGFRRGGVNGLPVTVAGQPTNPELFEYEPDTVINTEVGIKGSINGRFNYGLSFFNMDWQDVQIDAAATQLILQSVENVGEARSRGAELEVSGALTRNWFVSAGATYVDATWTKIDAPEGLDGLPQAGDRLPGTRKFSGNVHLRYARDIFTDKELSIGLTGSYRSDVPPGTGRAASGLTSEAYSTWDLSATLRFNDQWSVRAFANNLFDEQANFSYLRQDYVQTNDTPLFGIPPSASSPRLTPFNDRAWSRITPPRTIGFVVTYDFGL